MTEDSKSYISVDTSGEPTEFHLDHLRICEMRDQIRRLSNLCVLHSVIFVLITIAVGLVVRNLWLK